MNKIQDIYSDDLLQSDKIGDKYYLQNVTSKEGVLAYLKYTIPALFSVS